MADFVLHCNELLGFIKVVGYFDILSDSRQVNFECFVELRIDICNTDNCVREISYMLFPEAVERIVLTLHAYRVNARAYFTARRVYHCANRSSIWTDTERQVERKGK
jgi:hypothetical protein